MGTNGEYQRKLAEQQLGQSPSPPSNDVECISPSPITMVDLDRFAEARDYFENGHRDDPISQRRSQLSWLLSTSHKYQLP